ncbi:hypothetical protein GP486_005999 [Trichoglossum hirsutum]|uniref:Reticulon-like protein n=1 Tax=Trichoglossum hirsutum TaxID=265104 RepID=A0A9P8L868_9PEZI|nr:hypothetical protein GP486_005999 [Trichoglossum hirsutum]
MTDLDPALSDLHSDVTYPSTENSTILNGRAPATKESAIDSKDPKHSHLQQTLPKLTTVGAQATLKDVTTNVKGVVNNGESLLTFHPGPVAENVKAGYVDTRADFSGLANSRATPVQVAATGQPLTAYHSFFCHLLSWKNPRATLVTFVTAILSILAFRYFNIARWVFKGLYLILGITAAAELVGRLTISHGLTSQFRPRRYYTIPRETVDAFFDELHELLNFFMLEFQRILYAENVLHTIASLTLIQAFAASLLGYWLIKVVPLWGLTLIATSAVFLAPLIYISNREIIDSQVQYITDVINEQTAQVKDIAGQHTARATETAKAYASDLSSKAQQYVGSARARSASPEAKRSTAIGTPASSASTTPSKSKITAYNSTTPQAPMYTNADFPAAPKKDFSSPVDTSAHEEEKPWIAA